MKDIFIDNDYATCFSNPPSEYVAELICWLKESGSLLVSQKLINEYKDTLRNCTSLHNLAVIISIQQKSGRLNMKKNKELKKIFFKKKKTKKFLSNRKDWDHIKLFSLSTRKVGITKDNKLRHDLKFFVKGSSVEDCVTKIEYE